MISRTLWLDRQFDKDLPVEMFPNLLERLRGTPARVEERLRGVDRPVLEARSGSSWSILENVGHLWLEEALWAARLDDFEAERAELTPATFDATRVTAAGFNSRLLHELTAGFRADRALLVSRLERLDGRVLQVVSLHPRLQRPMRLVDLMSFVAEHDDHHLVAITRLMGEAAG